MKSWLDSIVVSKRDLFVALIFSCLTTLNVQTDVARAITPQSSCLNDTGNGALLWGTADEQTTYIGPYTSLMAPKIAKLSENSFGTDGASANSGGANRQGSTIDPAIVNEAGTILGTDGKLYEYYFVPGVEPRRIVETRRVPRVSEDGKTIGTVDQTTERVVMEPVLIRVLRPVRRVGDGDPKTSSDSLPSPCEPIAPAPCEKVGSETDAQGKAAVKNESEIYRASNGSIIVSTSIPCAKTSKAGKEKSVLVLPENVRPKSKK